MKSPRPLDRAFRWARENERAVRYQSTSVAGRFFLVHALAKAYWAGLMSERRRVRQERERMEKLLTIE